MHSMRYKIRLHIYNMILIFQSKQNRKENSSIESCFAILPSQARFDWKYSIILVSMLQPCRRDAKPVRYRALVSGRQCLEPRRKISQLLSDDAPDGTTKTKWPWHQQSILVIIPSVNTTANANLESQNRNLNMRCFGSRGNN